MSIFFYFNSFVSYLFSGLGRRKLAYDLSDKMFDRDLFLSCSWTGFSTDTQAFPDGKFAFRKLKNTIQIFWDIINNADDSYSFPDNQNFLQSLMTRANQRSIQDNGRKRKSGASKLRPKGLKYKKRKLAHQHDDRTSSDQQLNIEIESTNIGTTTRKKTLAKRKVTSKRMKERATRIVKASLKTRTATAAMRARKMFTAMNLATRKRMRTAKKSNFKWYKNLKIEIFFQVATSTSNICLSFTQIYEYNKRALKV